MYLRIMLLMWHLATGNDLTTSLPLRVDVGFARNPSEGGRGLGGGGGGGGANNFKGGQFTLK